MRTSPVLQLPEVLCHIAAATDTDTALKIAANYGGIRVYIPARPDADHWLTHLVGAEKALKVCQALVANQGGIDILIPMGPDASKRQRWQRMQRLIDQNHPKRQIARACGTHERTVQRHRNDRAKTVKPLLAQADLFEQH